MEYASSEIFFDSLSHAEADGDHNNLCAPNPLTTTANNNNHHQSSTTPSHNDDDHHLHLPWDDDPLDLDVAPPSPSPFLFSPRPFWLGLHRAHFDEDEDDDDDEGDGSEWRNVLVEEELHEEGDHPRRNVDRDSPGTVEYLRDGDDDADPEFYVGYHDLSWASEIPTGRGTAAARSAVAALRTVAVARGDEEALCVVCRDVLGEEEEATQLPCSHLYHGRCVLPWLAVANTCPLCRYELPTDDARYGKTTMTT